MKTKTRQNYNGALTYLTGLSQVRAPRVKLMNPRGDTVFKLMTWDNKILATVIIPYDERAASTVESVIEKHFGKVLREQYNVKFEQYNVKFEQLL